MRVLRTAYILLILLLVFMTADDRPAHAESGEYQVKAAMIFNFTRFMEWPEDALPASASHLTVCVAGKGPLAEAVDGLRDKQVKGKVVSVRTVASGASITGCQLLVMGELDRSAVTGLLERSHSIPVLTVAESAGFAGSGGVVGFVLQGGKVRFEINTAAAQRHRIKISAQLLKLAQIVQESQ